MEPKVLLTRIHSELFDVMSDTHLRKHLLISSFLPPSNPYILIRLRHFVSRGLKPVEVDVEFSFTSEYPSKPPLIKFLPNPQINIEIPQVISQCNLTQSRNWTQNITLKQILHSMLQSMGIFWEALANFDHNLQLIALKKQAPRLKQSKSYSQQKGSLVHLEMLLLKRFREVTIDIEQKINYQVFQKYIGVIDCCKRGQLNFEDTFNILIEDKCFRDELTDQLNNGLWIHRILKSTSGIIYKKMLIGYSSSLLNRIYEFQRSKDFEEKAEIREAELKLN